MRGHSPPGHSDCSGREVADPGKTPEESRHFCVSPPKPACTPQPHIPLSLLGISSLVSRENSQEMGLAKRKGFFQKSGCSREGEEKKEECEKRGQHGGWPEGDKPTAFPSQRICWCWSLLTFLWDPQRALRGQWNESQLCHLPALKTWASYLINSVSYSVKWGQNTYLIGHCEDSMKFFKYQTQSWLSFSAPPPFLVSCRKPQILRLAGFMVWLGEHLSWGRVRGVCWCWLKYSKRKVKKWVVASYGLGNLPCVSDITTEE